MSITATEAGELRAQRDRAEACLAKIVNSSATVNGRFRSIQVSSDLFDEARSIVNDPRLCKLERKLDTLRALDRALSLLR
jgi:hypothetical protein